MLVLLSPPTSARVRSRIAENAAAFTFLLPGDASSIADRALLSLGGTAYLAYCLALPGGYVLGAYTAGAYLLGGGFIRAQLSLPPYILAA